MIENFLNSCRRHREMLRFSVLAIFIIWVVWQLHSSPYILHRRKADIFSRAFETVAYGKAAVSFCLKHFDTLYPMQSAGAVYWEGSSGSGKSTLLNCIATVIQPTGGSIQVEGDTLQSLKGKALAE